MFSTDFLKKKALQIQCFANAKISLQCSPGLVESTSNNLPKNFSTYSKIAYDQKNVAHIFSRKSVFELLESSLDILVEKFR